MSRTTSPISGTRRRSRRSRWGATRGGQPFDKANLYLLLTNPLYAGKITHKRVVHDGVREAIVTPTVFAKLPATANAIDLASIRAAIDDIDCLWPTLAPTEVFQLVHLPGERVEYDAREFYCGEFQTALRQA